MNKNLYRIIYNVARGTWIAVAEIVKARGKSSSPVTGTGSKCTVDAAGSYAMRRLTLSIMFALGSAVILVPQAQADVIADGSAPASQRPDVTQTASGITQVNINTPSGAGVSRNVYSQFDVEQEGVVLNNGRTPSQTQLAGWVNGNPNLATGTARIILNEVNSSNPSSLLGFIEIAGTRAQVVVANPAGITCSGCGFINASRATVTTGTPIMNGGSLDGFQVSDGTITIEGDGMDATGSNHTDLIARAVEINAGIWANDLNITTGANRVSTDNSQVIEEAATGSAPAFAIDVAALGGMYAGKIKLVGTEDGVGVRNAGVVGSTAGDITITADGRLQNSNTITSAQNLTVDTKGDIDNSGTLYAQANTHLTIDGDLTNRGVIDGQETVIDTATLNNIGTGRIYGDHVAIEADTLNNQSEGGTAPVIAARNRMDIGAGELNNNEDAIMFSGGDLHIAGELDGDNHAAGRATTINNISATIEALGDLSIDADTLVNKRASLEISQVTATDIPTGRELLDYDPLRYKFFNHDDQPMSIWRDHYRNVYLARIADIPGIDIDSAYRAELVATVNSLPLTRTVDGVGFTSNIWNAIIDKINADHPEWIDTMVQRLSGSTYPLVSYDQQCVDPGCDYVNYISHRRTDTIDTVTASSAVAAIMAGGDANLNIGDLSNIYSTIEAGGDMDITGDTLLNQGIELYRNSNIITSTTTIHWTDRNHGTTVEPSSSSTLLETIPAIISAGGSLTGSYTGLIDNVAIRENSAPTTNSISTPTLTDNNLPNNILFQVNPDSTSGYLVETDSAFASYRDWLSSDYMLNALAIDPTLSQKRMGDGFYEQQLVRQQISQITGKRYLPGFSDDEGQYKALMNAGVTFALEYELIPGVALNAEQMANLTSDMVWLVEEEVTLPDGSTQQVLVPRLYATTKPQALNSGALIAADVVNLSTDGDLGNSGDIIGRRVVAINAGNINSVGGRIRAGDELRAIAQHDLSLASSLAETHMELSGVHADGSVRATADIKQMNRIAGLYVENPDAILVASAGNDLNLEGATVENRGVSGQTTLTAGRDLNLGTITETQNSRATFKKGWFRDERSKEVGSTIETTGNAMLIAERNINARAANAFSEQGIVTAVAGQNITIEAGEAEQHQQRYRKSSKKGFLSSKSTTVFNTLDTSTALASTFSGEQVNLQAGNDLIVAGSVVVGTGDVNLNAGRDIDITSVDTTHDETHFRDEKKSGLFSSSGGFGVTWGKQQKTDTVDQQTVRQVSSTIGSLEGDINVDADRDVTITASDVLAQSGSINVSGENVTIDSAYDTLDLEEEHKFKQSGITLALSGGIVDTIQTIRTSAERIDTAKDKRLKALNAWRLKRSAESLSKGFANLDHIGQDFADPIAENKEASSGVNLSISIGSSSSKQEITQHDETALGSSLLAHNEINITARGNTDEGPIEEGGVNLPAAPTGGDINMEGALLEAANINLNANNELNLKSAENTHDREENSESKSSGIGFSIGSDGLMFFVEGSVSRGEVNQTSDKYLETLINGSNKVSMLSGGDTTLEGAQVNAPRIEVESGGDLNIISQQDEEHYENDQKSAGFKVAAGYGRWSVSVNASQLEADSDYVAVQEQSGLFAGDQGYDVEVEKNTHLEGGAIVSSADPENNRLNTDTLSHNEIHNYAKYDVESKSISFSTSSSGPSGPTKGLGGGFSDDSGEAENTTYAAISQGEVTVRSNPEQSLTGLKRSKEEAHKVLERIFTEDKIQQAQETVELTQIFAEEGYMAVGKLYDDLTKAEARLETAKKNPDIFPPEAIEQLRLDVEQERAKLPFDKSIAHALIGGITAILGGGNFMQGALAAGVNEAVATEIKANLSKDATLQNLAAVLIGGALGGGQGAIIAGTADQYNRQLHPTEIDWILENAEAFKEQEGLADEKEAIIRLARQSLRMVDDKWKTVFKSEDSQAMKFLLAAVDPDAGMFYATNDEKSNFMLGSDILLHGEHNDPLAALSTDFGDGSYVPYSYTESYKVSDFYDEYILPGAVPISEFSVDTLGLGLALTVKHGVEDFGEAGEALGVTAAKYALDEVSTLKLLAAISVGAIQGVGELQKDIDRIQMLMLYGDSEAATVEISKLTPALLAAGTLKLVKVGTKGTALGADVKLPVDAINKALDEIAQKALFESGGKLDAAGNPILDMKLLTNAQKGQFGELFGENLTKKIVPDGEKLARIPGIGETGIDDLYKVSRPDVDYVVVEYKFVGDMKTPGSSRLGDTGDGLQGSESWITGGDRLERSVGSRSQANAIRESLDEGRIEAWVVTTRPDGSMEIEVLDSFGKVKDVDTSAVLKSINLNRGA